MRRLAVAVVVAFLAGEARADEDHAAPLQSSYDFSEPVPGAARLEGRIRAPCCLSSTGQTLDIHGSPVALELRREIRERLKKGDSPDSIEKDFVGRYGPEILAVPPGNPLGKVGAVLAGIFAVAGIGAGALLLRWRRRGLEELAARKRDLPDRDSGSTRDALDDRIDAELDDL